MRAYTGEDRDNWENLTRSSSCSLSRLGFPGTSFMSKVFYFNIASSITSNMRTLTPNSEGFLK